MLRRTKLAVLNTVRATGGMQLVSNINWRRQKLLILGYHGISMRDEHEWDPLLFMSPGRFEQRLRTLRNGGFNVLPLAEAIARLHRNDLPPKAVVLTFDDGFANFHQQAFPLLKAYDMPATVYLTTFYCYYNRPIFGLMIRYLLWRAQGRTETIKDSTLGWNTPQDVRTPGGIAAAIHLLNKHVDTQRASAAHKEELAETLAGHLKLDYEQLSSTKVMHFMTPDQAAEIHAGGISIELHTHRHRTPRNLELFAREIRDNRDKIRLITGKSARHFCYPSGVWRKDMFSTLKENGVETGTTCDPGLAFRDTNPLLLPRYVDTTTDIEFEGWISGVSQFLPRKNYVR